MGMAGGGEADKILGSTARVSLEASTQAKQQYCIISMEENKSEMDPNPGHDPVVPGHLIPSLLRLKDIPKVCPH